jgi:ribosomal protein S8
MAQCLEQHYKETPHSSLYHDLFHVLQTVTFLDKFHFDNNKKKQYKTVQEMQ